MQNDTIVSISTPLGTGAISIIRMSGFNSLQIAKKVFSCKSLDYSKIKPRYLYLGNINLQAESEQCLMVYFKEPFSYTGENLIEFQCHGGELLTEKILEICIKNGARLAECGEFSKRAFINGKISLEKAEGIINIINAQSEAELLAGHQLANGELYKLVKEVQEKTLECLALVNVSLDYPEHDAEIITNTSIKKILEEQFERLNNLVKHSETNKKIKTGINIAIVGLPNVGKSSLLNALVGEERAIVTDIEGTTRDVIKDTVIYKGIKFNFYDTAGLREAKDEPEKIGINLTKKQIENADIVLFICDISKPILEEEKNILNLIKKEKLIKIGNKIDKKCEKNDFFNDFLLISAKNKINIDKVFNLIYDKVIAEKIDFSGLVIANNRHIICLQNSVEILNKIFKIINKQTLDIIAMELMNLWNELGKITGETETEIIIDEIFSRFCLGK